MEALITLGITVLFSCWVYLLKHEVGDLEKRLLTRASASSQAQHALSHILHDVKDESAAVRQQDSGRTTREPRQIRREQGVPTWTIA